MAETRDKFKRLAADTIVFAVGSLGSKLILFFLVPLYTNVMATDEYGTADLVVTIGQLLVPFVSLVVFDASLRFGLSRYERKEDVLLVSLAVLAGGSMVTVAATPLFGLYGAVTDYKWFLCGYVVAYMASNIELTYLKVEEKNRLFAGMSILQTVLIASLNILLLTVLRLGVAGYLLSNIVALAVVDVAVFLVGGYADTLRRAHFDGALAKRMLSYSAPLVLNNVSWWVIHSADKILVEWALGAAALGLFTVASKIPSLINTVVNIFQQAWGISSIREIESSNDPKYYSEVFSVYSMLCIGACIAIVAMIKPFMSVYVGADYFEAWHYVPLLLVAAALSGVSSFFGQMYGALKKSVNSMASTLVSAAVNVAVCVALLAPLGVWAAVLGTLASYAVIAFVRMVDVLCFVRFDVHLGRYMACLAIALAQAALVSLDFHVYAVSAVAIALFVFVNKSLIAAAFGAAKKSR